MRDPASGMRSDLLKGTELPVGTDTVRSASALNIFKKPPIKAELAMEVLAPSGGRKLRAFYGREPGGSWRGRVEDIGYSTENNPYAFIRVLDDEVVNLADVENITGEMALGYEQAVERDREERYEEDLYNQLASRLEELQYNTREMKKDFEAGMHAFFGANWREVAQELFPGGKPW